MSGRWGGGEGGGGGWQWCMMFAEWGERRTEVSEGCWWLGQGLGAGLPAWAWGGRAGRAAMGVVTGFAVPVDPPSVFTIFIPLSRLSGVALAVCKVFFVPPLLLSRPLWNGLVSNSKACLVDLLLGLLLGRLRIFNQDWLRPSQRCTVW